MSGDLRHLRTTDQLAGRGDDVFALLLEAHAGLTDAESQALNARLILLLANHIGDFDVVAEALTVARASVNP